MIREYVPTVPPVEVILNWNVPASPVAGSTENVGAPGSVSSNVVNVAVTSSLNCPPVSCVLK